MLALVTCDEAVGVDTDLPLLQAAMPEASIVSWRDDRIDWSAYRTVVLRSTWDYHRDLERFRRWAQRVGAASDLWNPLALIEWNLDKRYLADVAGWGAPIVPTVYLDDRAALERHAAADGFAGELVVKPSVGASASGVLATHGDEAVAIDHAERLVNAGFTAMVQPYLSSVATTGETGLVYLGGAFSHAFGRRVVLREHAELDGDGFGNEESEPRVATPAERAVGDLVVAHLPDTAYTRIDLLPTDDGPVVLEVEVIEPSLFLHLDPEAPARAAAAFRSLSV